MDNKKLLYFLIPLMFLVYSAPSALEYLFFFPDEKHYTDAAIQMMDKHDYFTPYQANGSPRYKKPIVTYWVLIASYKLFGVSPVSSRLFFWLAAAMLVLIVFLMTKSILKNREIAIIAAFITMANPLFLMSASRSIPDVLLLLFLTISAWGFLKIMQSEKPRKIFYWMAYLGAGFAVETKGVPAVAFAGISILFLLFNPWRKIKFAKLFEPFSMFVSFLVTIGWFAIMSYQHGADFWNLFFEDQVGMRIASKVIQTIKNLSLGVICLLAYFIPWVIMLFMKKNWIKSFWKAQHNEIKAFIGFFITWIVLMLIMSGAVFRFYDRYLLPVFPLVAILFSFIFYEKGSAFKKTILNILIGLNIFVLAINIGYVFFISINHALIAGICFSLILITAYYNDIFDKISKEVFIANAVALLYFNVFLLLTPFLLPDIGMQINDNLNRLGVKNNEKIYVYGNIRIASMVRVSSHNSLNVISMDTVFVLPQSTDSWLVVNEKEKNMLNLKEYNIYIGSQKLSQLNVSDFPLFLQKPVTDFKMNGENFLIGRVKEQGNGKY